jgi:signal peptidase II
VNSSLKKNIFIVGAIIALILFLDQAIKIYIKSYFVAGEETPIIGHWFKLIYIENQGMAFGTTFGSQAWHKLALSIFRIIAIFGIGYYWYQQAKKGVKREFLIAVGLILAGAAGNLIDSMFYDFIFKYDPCMPFNHLVGSGIKTNCGIFGEMETRHTGFLFANVVDMFKFEAHWPDRMPLIGGNEVFPAIWNLADFAITTGIVLIFVRQRTYFPKVKTITNQKNRKNDSVKIEDLTTDIKEENEPID